MSFSRKQSEIQKEDIAKVVKNIDHPRVVIMGAAGVGKTAIVEQFLYDRFPVDHVPTVEEMHSSVYDISSSKLTLDILDTSGSYEFTAMRELAIKTGDAFILIYAIDNKDSFDFVSTLRELIIKIRQQKERAPIVVVGNKCDLESARAVPKDVTESVMTIDWENGFVESSAKENINVLQIFKTMLTQAHICYALGPAVERRRKSLPVHSSYLKQKTAINQKIHSCIIQ